MLTENIKIEYGKGEYKDFPHQYRIKLYGKCVWQDDFPQRLTEREVVGEFVKELEYVKEEL